MARFFDRQGFRVFAACRVSEGEGAKSLQVKCSENVKVIQLDVTKDEEVENAVTKVKEELGDGGKKKHECSLILTGVLKMGRVCGFTKIGLMYLPAIKSFRHFWRSFGEIYVQFADISTRKFRKIGNLKCNISKCLSLLLNETFCLFL